MGIPSVFWIIVAGGIVVSMLLLITTISEIINPLSWGILAAAFLIGIIIIVTNCGGKFMKMIKKLKRKGGE